MLSVLITKTPSQMDVAPWCYKCTDYGWVGLDGLRFFVPQEIAWPSWIGEGGVKYVELEHGNKNRY